MTLKLIDRDILIHRLFTSEFPWGDMDTEDIVKGIPVVTIRVPDGFLRTSFEFRDQNVGAMKS